MSGETKGKHTPRPDNRPAEIVWAAFDVEFVKCPNFPSVSWALGSDWGWGLRIVTAEQYKAAAEARMTALYGPRAAIAKAEG